jgi:hypothetical protein
MSMKRSELTNQQKLLVPCPICRAPIGVRCQMYSGLGRRNEPHAERKYQAVQAIEQDGMVIRLATPIGTRST